MPACLACLSTLIIHLEVRSFSIHLHLELAIFAITSACVLFIIGLMVGFLLGDKKGLSEIGVTL
jgi:hypothetical protein